MDQETKRLVEENLRLSEETNEIVKKVWRSHKWARFSRIFYWLFIVVVVTGAYYYVQPYIEGILGVYNGAASGIQDIQERAQSLPDSKTISDFLNKFKVQ